VGERGQTGGVWVVYTVLRKGWRVGLGAEGRGEAGVQGWVGEAEQGAVGKGLQAEGLHAVYGNVRRQGACNDAHQRGGCLCWYLVAMACRALCTRHTSDSCVTHSNHHECIRR
jgi:hypothetical protein